MSVPDANRFDKQKRTKTISSPDPFGSAYDKNIF